MEVTPLLTLHCVEFQDSRWRVLGRPGLLSGLLPPSAGVRRAVCPPPPHHTLSCTNLDLDLVTTRVEGSTHCTVMPVSYVLVMSVSYVHM